jgi:hypothetical protein
MLGVRKYITARPSAERRCFHGWTLKKLAEMTAYEQKEGNLRGTGSAKENPLKPLGSRGRKSMVPRGEGRD